MMLNLKQTLLQRAAKLLHGKDKLALELAVPEPMLDAWMDGSVDMPDSRMPKLSAILARAGDQTRGGV